MASVLILASQMLHGSVGLSKSITLSEAPEPDHYDALSLPRKLHLCVSPRPRVLGWDGVTNLSSCCMTLTSLTMTWKAQEHAGLTSELCVVAHIRLMKEDRSNSAL